MPKQTIGSVVAKSRLFQMLNKVQRGQTFVITRRGKPVAILSPVAGECSTRSRSLVHRCRALRAVGHRGPETLKQLICRGDTN
ncbi:MAG: type II toxin-antitoxin system prevent-host-death family antitoxin [Verrucomicrobiota bacterium]